MKTARTDVYKSGHVDYDALDTMRHSAAHLLASAVKELWPETKFGIGPTTENGFYYDFEFPVKVSADDFPRIESMMEEIKKKNLPFIRTEQSVEDALAQAQAEGQTYKAQLIEGLMKTEHTVSVYTDGSFSDLCKGPHVASTGEIGAIKLLSVAGAYWKGDEHNPMLTRIYGTCYATKEELATALANIEEAKKRDHRKIGKEQELFLVSPDVGLGYPLLMPKGMVLKREMERFITAEKEKRGYQFVWTPHIGKSDLYRKSGHWQKYDAMMSPMTIDDEEYVVKPMNCPHHFQIYLETPKSYRDLPLRLAENATVYRYEKAGELNGLLRVRSLTQDDTHTFVRESQIPDEIDRILDLAVTIYKTFGFSEYRARISTHDPNAMGKYLGKAETWDAAEAALVAAVEKHGMPFFVGVGEAAFYGPKIDIMVKDALGREWQLTTVQLDFNQPVNFDMTYVNEEGKPERPAVLHIAILGSFERFLAIVIEQTGGAFPVWLSPVQAVLVPIAERHIAKVREMEAVLKQAGIRAVTDDKNEPMGAKVRRATLQKTPYIGIIGDREAESNTLSVRLRGGEQLKDISLDEFVRRIANDIEHKV